MKMNLIEALETLASYNDGIENTSVATAGNPAFIIDEINYLKNEAPDMVYDVVVYYKKIMVIEEGENYGAILYKVL